MFILCVKGRVRVFSWQESEEGGVEAAVLDQEHIHDRGEKHDHLS